MVTDRLGLGAILEVVGDDAWKGKINFYIEGVEGKIPSGK